MTRLAELLALAERATKGPWESRDDQDYYQCGRYIGAVPFYYGRTESGRPCEVDGRNPKAPMDCYFRNSVARIEGSDDDEAFIKAAREAVPDLVLTVRELRAILQQAVDADALAEWFTDTDHDGVDVRAALAACDARFPKGASDAL